MLSKALIARVKQHEGFRDEAYLDTEGVLTVGFGTNLESRLFSEDECEGWLFEDLDTAFDELCGVDAFMTLNKIRREVLIEMVYNLGFSGVMKFKKMWAAIEVNDFEEAAIQMLDSKWHRQVGQRAKTLAKLMGDGSE